MSGVTLAGRVAVVTGGGGGIGSAVSEKLARRGARVVVVDPGVGVEGEPLEEPTAAETARRINEAGGEAVSSTASVTDLDALLSLFDDVRARLGALDIVVNPAGIIRSRSLPDSTEDDWSAVLGVHLGGYLNVLAAALPSMAESGHGRVVGFTSGVGLARTAGDAMVYGAAKRAVAALTWQVGDLLPQGVSLNALSPIAATRMVRSTIAGSGAKVQNLDLSAMPQPHDMAPAAVYLAGEAPGWLRGQVVFSAGSELSVISRPRLIESVRTEGVVDWARLLGTVIPAVLSPAERHQRSGGGSNPRFGDVYSPPVTGRLPGQLDRPAEAAAHGGTESGACLVVSDDPVSARTLVDAVSAWNLRAVGPGGRDPVAASAGSLPEGFDRVARSLELKEARVRFDAVILALRSEPLQRRDPGRGWAGFLDSQRSTCRRLVSVGAWLRAAALHAAETSRQVRIIVLAGAADDAGQPCSQAVAQLARSVNDSTLPVRVQAFSISLESDRGPDLEAAAHLAARLAAADDAPELEGAELVVGRGWIGLRSHPAPTTTVSFGGPDIPPFVDEALRAGDVKGA